MLAQVKILVSSVFMQYNKLITFQTAPGMVKQKILELEGVSSSHSLTETMGRVQKNISVSLLLYES